LNRACPSADDAFPDDPVEGVDSGGGGVADFMGGGALKPVGAATGMACVSVPGDCGGLGGMAHCSGVADARARKVLTSSIIVFGLRVKVHHRTFFQAR